MNDMTFTDLFGAHADDYLRYRPGPPDELCRFVLSRAADDARLLDCGTGNGQAAVALAPHFRRVDAIDASVDQIGNAQHRTNVHYAVADATRPLPFGDQSMSAVIAATALHWFSGESFFDEVRRVLKTNGVFVAWTYADTTCDPAIEEVVREFSRCLGPYWDARVVEHRAVYEQSIPLQPIDIPDFYIVRDWSMHDFIGYLRTWSAFRSYLVATGEDPFWRFGGPLADAWGAHPIREIRWKLQVIAGRK